MSTGQKLSVILIAGLLGMITSKLVLEVFLSRAVSWTGNFRKGRRNNFAAISVHVCSTLAQEHVCMHIAMELITTIITFLPCYMTLLCTHVRLEVIIFVIFMLLEESQSFQSPVYATPFVYLIATDKVITFADDLIWPLSQEYYFYRLMTFFLVFICLI